MTNRTGTLDGIPRAAAIVVAAVTAGVLTDRAQAQASFQDLGTAPGGGYTQANGISADGNVVVGEANYPFSKTQSIDQAMRWTEATGWVNIDTISGGCVDEFGTTPYSVARDASHDGALVFGSGEDAWHRPERESARESQSPWPRRRSEATESRRRPSRSCPEKRTDRWRGELRLPLKG